MKSDEELIVKFWELDKPLQECFQRLFDRCKEKPEEPRENIILPMNYDES